MNSNFHMNGPGAAFGVFAFLALLWGVAVTIFWMVCAWRAMRAHERLAESVERLSDRHQTER